MADDPADAIPESVFGNCCEELADAIEGGEMEDTELEPLITVGDDGILYFSVFLALVDGSEPGTVDHPLFFCPFCGTPTQDKQQVMAKLNALADDDRGALN